MSHLELPENAPEAMYEKESKMKNFWAPHIIVEYLRMHHAETKSWML